VPHSLNMRSCIRAKLAGALDGFTLGGQYIAGSLRISPPDGIVAVWPLLDVNAFILYNCLQNVDARVKPGHDDQREIMSTPSSTRTYRISYTCRCAPA
jgi:hypothetical protein